MTSKRASVFEINEDLDLSGFEPKPSDRPLVNSDQVRAVSEAVNFHSRDPQRSGGALTVAKREPRRHRTGRNMQLNIKARAEAIDEFYAISDRQGWVLGETFERAVEALKRDIEKR